MDAGVVVGLKSAAVLMQGSVNTGRAKRKMGNSYNLNIPLNLEGVFGR